MRLDIAAQTDIGRRKEKNEDSHGVVWEDDPRVRLFDEGALVCVADGLGGHTSGEIASKLSVSIVTDMVRQEAPAASEDPDYVDERDEGPLPVIRAAINKANDSIYQTNQDLVKRGKPMGTTVLAALIAPKKVYIGNVGDSRCYHIRDGEIIAQTEDHSWVDEQVKQGLMSKAEAEMDRRKNIVTRCVGTHPDISVDTYRWFILPGDMLLLCTDGLVNMVPDADIKKIFRQNGTTAEIAQKLVALANENGGKDNITVIVAHISPSFLRMILLRTRSFLRRHGFGLGWALFMIFYGLSCGLLGYALNLIKPLTWPPPWLPL